MLRNTRRASAALLLVGYAALPVLANWLIGHVGAPTPRGAHVIPVGFGLVAPSGVLAAAAALTLRDAVQELAGRRGAIAAIVCGAVISYLVADPFIALASAVAFLVSELSDFLVYTPLRARGRVVAAVGASNTIGLLVDSVLFLSIAGLLTPELLAGQIVGKAWIGIGAALFVWLRQQRQRTAV